MQFLRHSGFVYLFTLPGLKTIIAALLKAMRMLSEVLVLTLFCLMVFALFSLQVYVGVLRQKCVLQIPQGMVVTDSSYLEHIKNESKLCADWCRVIAVRIQEE